MQLYLPSKLARLGPASACKYLEANGDEFPKKLLISCSEIY